MFALVWVARGGERIFHYLFLSALIVGSIVYFAQASDLGWSLVPQVNNVQNGVRQIFWAKYVFWVVAFPVIIIALGLLSGVSWATIFYNVFVSWVWVISYLVAAYTTSRYKWGFFAFGTAAYLALAVHTLRDGNVGAKRLGVTRDHSSLSGWVNLLWLLYPIAWGLSDGGNYIGVTPSFIWFGILDFLLIPVTAWAFMFLARRWDYNRLNINFTQYGRVNHQPGHFPEKNNTATAPAPAVATA
jgi:bacteriorhodopsin